MIVLAGHSFLNELTYEFVRHSIRFFGSSYHIQNPLKPPQSSHGTRRWNAPDQHITGQHRQRRSGNDPVPFHDFVALARRNQRLNFRINQRAFHKELTSSCSP